MSVLKIKKDGVWESVSGASGHTHTVNDITDFPSNLPTGGGDADTLDGKHASDFAAVDHTHEQLDVLAGLVGDTDVSTQIADATIDKAEKDHVHNDVTETVSGFMSSDDKKKLDSVEEGANKIVIDSALSDTSINPVQNKVISDEIERVYSTISDMVGDTSVSEQIANATDGKADWEHGHESATSSKDGFLSSDDKNKLDSIDYNANLVEVVDNLADVATTKALSANQGVELKSQIDNHTQSLDRITETQDKKIMTAAERTKLQGIDEGANLVTVVNNLESTSSTAALSAYQGKVLKDIVDNINTGGSDYVHPSTHPASMITGLSEVATSGDYNDLSNKPNIPDAYTHPTYTAKTSGFYKITVDSKGHVSGTSAVTKSDITNLGIPGSDTKVTVVDNLTSTSTTSALSANQGKILNQKAGHITTGESVTIDGKTVTCGNNAERFNTTTNKASGVNSHAEGNYTIADGDTAHAEGGSTRASGTTSHAEGETTTASGNHSHAEGERTTASGTNSHASGYYTIAKNYQFVLGYYNPDFVSTRVPTGAGDQSGKTLFSIGNGSSSSRNEAFAVHNNGTATLAGKAVSVGSDFAEYFEWFDGNPNNEDRRGKIVTLDGDKIKLASAGDDVLGVITSTGAFIGNSASLQWKDKYLTDIFGERLLQDVEVPGQVDEVTGEITPAYTIKQWILNPEYDPTKEYVGREDRPEWAPVGMLGQVIVVDDGSCVVNGYCLPSADGIGTASNNGYRVLKRIDDTHIKVLVR